MNFKPQLFLIIFFFPLVINAQSFDEPMLEIAESDERKEVDNPGELILLEEGMPEGYKYVEYGSYYEYPENPVSCIGKWDGTFITRIRLVGFFRVGCISSIHQKNLNQEKVFFQMTKGDSFALDMPNAYDIPFYTRSEAQAIKEKYVNTSDPITLAFPLNQKVAFPLGFDESYKAAIEDKVNTEIKGQVAGFYYGTILNWLDIPKKDYSRFLFHAKTD